MKLIFDINGGDNKSEIIRGAIEASNEFNVEVILVGREDFISENLSELNYDRNKIEIVDAKENIENNEDPAFALRRKKDSSIVKSMELLKSKKADAIISAGSTGALLAGGIFIVGRIKGIKRAVLPTVIPGLKSNTMIIDSGANMDTDADLLKEFAMLGDIFLREYYKIESPKVGLLNVGTEEGKGNSLSKETFEELKNSELNFVGNIEARNITNNDLDLVVCDGFDGNILLKSIEGVVEFSIKNILQTIEKSNFDNEIKNKLNKNLMSSFKDLDAKKVGGTLLLGIDGNIIKAHGNSNSEAIKNAAKYAIDIVESNIVKKIKEKVEKNER
ncbi:MULTISPECIES: phosphate acyltransferase PlsX [Peptoniphilus]|uniref:phosphate acyltransferase PlsX n=2 Tax=Peptoniphilaceae TaxID=1570339 RepID=UPI00290520CD|nr:MULTISPECIES: phosphate acyltransferase PlsX [Peptoniphilus]MDU1043443.1 phosphate acyltransferase PlsX [Peptoniphilus rhinitidis]MDU1954158.1 phosphate acyltransferase PlsX [Peptoniphilus lacydonensis]MDU2110637.1 phosphate acyltransferase PlsX [Peptoniphilus lacydonensis]MDU2115894.1 phosphate acyltransferase PlsX [Peptoniphilus lacydonensis]MDU5274666.1 phosphate acyltransferase PlsX [Peptoniphilus lacydonensis]